MLSSLTIQNDLTFITSTVSFIKVLQGFLYLVQQHLLVSFIIINSSPLNIVGFTNFEAAIFWNWDQSGVWPEFETSTWKYHESL